MSVVSEKIRLRDYWNGSMMHLCCLHANMYLRIIFGNVAFLSCAKLRVFSAKMMSIQ